MCTVGQSYSQSVACLKLFWVTQRALSTQWGRNLEADRAAITAAPVVIRLDQHGVATLASARKIHRCFERVNQLLSLLVPVSDINRAAAGFSGVAAQSAVAYRGNTSQTNPIPNRASGEV